MNSGPKSEIVCSLQFLLQDGPIQSQPNVMTSGVWTRSANIVVPCTGLPKNWRALQNAHLNLLHVVITGLFNYRTSHLRRLSWNNYSLEWTINQRTFETSSGTTIVHYHLPHWVSRRIIR